MDPRPCVNVSDLWEWQPPNGLPRKELDAEDGDEKLPKNAREVPPIEPLREGTIPRKLHPQFLVCHDYKGDFPECDRWEGCAVDKCAPFLFTHWWHMDTFVYFGHKMVTIPPAAYTSLAHRHGVLSLGTLMFEHAKGAKCLKSILASPAAMQRTIEKLVLIMKTWKFDGWLVNVEVSIDGVHEVPLLMIFVSNLTLATKQANPHALIVWYDAVCNDGTLAWQNTLNDMNKDFYLSADAIFINYGWKKKDLEDLQQCRYNKCASSVCVGVDVWGRNGGPAKWQSHEAVSKIKQHSLSVALFAPGWAVEADENKDKDPEENSFKFWSTFNTVMDTRTLDFFPFKTTFKNGFSEDGKIFRLRDMDMMPNFAHSNRELYPTARGLRIKKTGQHLLWKVKMLMHRDLRVRIKVEDTQGEVKIKLDRRDMKLDRIDEEGMTVLRPEKNECATVTGIYVVTSTPDTMLTYFEAYLVDLARCLQ